MREFETGATRDVDDHKFDYEGFLSPEVLARYAEYMHFHRFQKDGKMRDSDNWQKGMPVTAYMKSLWRHFMDVWRFHRSFLRGEYLDRHQYEEAICACMFNVMGLLHEVLRDGHLANHTQSSGRWSGRGILGGDLEQQYKDPGVPVPKAMGLGGGVLPKQDLVPVQPHPWEVF